MTHEKTASVRPVEVHKVAIESVTDASGLVDLLDREVFRADDVLAVIGKTEGNGGVNDYTRLLADRAFREVLIARGTRSAADVGTVPLVWSGGTDGVLSPHATVFAYAPAGRYQPTDEPRVSAGVAMSEPIRPEDIGRPAMVDKVSAGVARAMAAAGIDRAEDVHYVQTKTPLLVQQTIADAKSRGHTVVTEDTLHSMDISNSTTALGIAVALGEIEMPSQEQIHSDLSLYSAVASCSSGVELDRAQIVVVGNVRGIGGRFRAGHAVMRDAIDADGVWAALRSAGLDLPERPRPDDVAGRLVNVFVKCEADPSGRLRGRRTVMLDDSDVHWHRQIKAAVGGVVAAVTGDPDVFVSVAAVHQGPSGGGTVAAIVDLGNEGGTA
jgi:cyanuric acid amidohydrolase